MLNIIFNWVAISAIATFLMAVATFLSLYQNRKQLSELKKQWEEQNRPRIIPLLINIDNIFCLRLKNCSPSTAFDVKLSIIIKSETHLINKEISYIDKIESVKYIIESNGIKDFKLFRDYGQIHSNYNISGYDGYINIQIAYNNKYIEKFVIYLSELNNVMMPSTSIQDSLDKISQRLARL